MVEKKLFYPFVVEPFQEDYTGSLAWSTLGNLILRVSTLHAEAHNFGYTYMQTQRRGWVLSRLVLELDHLPHTGESYQLGTWVNRIYRQFTDRLYTITSPDGTPFGHGISTWALIDYDSRQPVNLETLPDGGFYDALLTEEVPIAGPAERECKPPNPCCDIRPSTPTSTSTAISTPFATSICSSTVSTRLGTTATWCTASKWPTDSRLMPAKSFASIAKP